MGLDGTKTQNDHFIISYSKFLKVFNFSHFLNYFLFSIIFGRLITNFVILLAFFKFLFARSKKHFPKEKIFTSNWI